MERKSPKLLEDIRDAASFVREATETLEAEVAAILAEVKLD
jgi:hypothetical protein